VLPDVRGAANPIGGDERRSERDGIRLPIKKGQKHILLIYSFALLLFTHLLIYSFTLYSFTLLLIWPNQNFSIKICLVFFNFSFFANHILYIKNLICWTGG
jgi:hypothetical protein